MTDPRSPMPGAGGSFERQKDGSLKPLQQPAEAPQPAPKPEKGSPAPAGDEQGAKTAPSKEA